MMIDVELDAEEVENLENGGFIVTIMDGLRVVITKNDYKKEEK